MLRLADVKKAVGFLAILLARRHSSRSPIERESRSESGENRTANPEFETISGRTPYFSHNLWFMSLTT
jgi:hypothetical protein